MSRKTASRSSSLKTLAVIALIAVIAISVNSLLPSPPAPAFTWKALLGLEKTDLPLPDGTMQVHFIDVGNADAALIRCGDKQMLIDGGEPDDGGAVVDYLRKQGVKRLDLVVATHPDADHIGGLPTVLTQLEVDRFLMSFMDDEHTPTSASYERLLTALEERDIPVTEAKPGQHWELGEAVVDVLGPVGEYEDTNNMSVVCKITFGKTRFLMMGDAERKAETALLKSGADLRADVLKAGHHGSRSSTSEKFLSAVAPTHAVLSCGVDNRYGHPHPETLQILQKHAVTVWRTDRCGTIVMISDGQTVDVQAQKERKAAA
ncbi:MAG: ComEC/Rec2 family competence protein [Acutalibacteraceae bacterium]|jgi:competence protein ComEC